MFQYRDFSEKNETRVLTPEQRTMIAVEALVKELRTTNNMLRAMCMNKETSEDKIEWKKPPANSW